MTRVELIYDRDCPNAAAARAELRRAFAASGHRPRWVEWDRDDPASPSYVRRYGSPTILVDGRDVTGVETAAGGACCRVYRTETGSLQGVPPAEAIVAALGRRRPGWRASLAALPAVGAALLPVGTCPACWPAYAAVLGSLGLGVLFQERYLLPLTLVLLGAALAGLGFRARSRRGYGPLTVGALAAPAILSGKFLLAAPAVLYAGVALLLAATVWNAWPRRRCGPLPDRVPRHAAPYAQRTPSPETEGGTP